MIYFHNNQSYLCIKFCPLKNTKRHTAMKLTLRTQISSDIKIYISIDIDSWFAGLSWNIIPSPGMNWKHSCTTRNSIMFWYEYLVNSQTKHNPAIHWILGCKIKFCVASLVLVIQIDNASLSYFPFPLPGYLLLYFPCPASITPARIPQNNVQVAVYLRISRNSSTCSFFPLKNK